MTDVTVALAMTDLTGASQVKGALHFQLSVDLLWVILLHDGPERWFPTHPDPPDLMP